MTVCGPPFAMIRAGDLPDMEVLGEAGCLIIGMKHHETVFVDFAGERCEVSLSEIREGQIKLRFKAPLTVRILREKIAAKQLAEAADGLPT